MTDKHDKLVALLRECGAEEAVTGLFYVTVKDIAAFAAAHVASLCADVKPWVWLVTGSRVFDDQVEFTQSKAEARIAERKDGSECVPLVPASVVASLTAQRDAALARVAELEKDAARYRWLRSVPNAFKAQRIVNDTPHGMDATIDAAMNGGNQ